MRIENIQPILNVRDMAASRHFYIDLLGFSEAEWGTDAFTSITRDHWGIYLCKGSQGHPGTWLWIGFDGDIFVLHKEFKEKGIKIIMEPRNFSYALEMHIEDPDGHVLRFGTDPNPDEPYQDDVGF